MVIAPNDIRSVDVQISRIHQTVTGLLLLAKQAEDDDEGEAAVDLSRRARNLTVEQFRLTQRRDDAIVNSGEWKALTDALDTVSASITQSMKDFSKISTTLAQVDGIVKQIDEILGL